MPYGVKDITVDVRTAELTAIIGPNGAGKSTLLNIMGGLRTNYSGACLYRGRELRQWSKREFARKVSVAPQSLQVEFPFTAEQVVMMGRSPFSDGLFEAPGDREEVERAMSITDTLPFRGRDFRTLSGGERQRVILAAALAQSPEFLLLDEPTTFLDLQHQLAIYRLLVALCGRGLGVLTVTHDLNIALTYATRVILIQAGAIIADGAPSAILTPEALARTFGVRATLRDADSRPWITYEP